VDGWKIPAASTRNLTEILGIGLPGRAEGDGAILPNGRHPGGRNVLPVVPNGLREPNRKNMGQNRWTSTVKTGGLHQVDFNFPIFCGT